MRFQNHNRHIIDLIFPISLFFVFAASSLAVVILAANIYSSTTGRGREDDQTRIALAYLTEKFRQNDAGGTASLEEIEGIDCLAFTSYYDHMEYVTYIYDYDGELKELFMKKGTQIALKNGKDILPVEDLVMETIRVENSDEKIYRFSCKSADGSTVTSVVSERSVP